MLYIRVYCDNRASERAVNSLLLLCRTADHASFLLAPADFCSASVSASDKPVPDKTWQAIRQDVTLDEKLLLWLQTAYGAAVTRLDLIHCPHAFSARWPWCLGADVHPRKRTISDFSAKATSSNTNECDLTDDLQRIQRLHDIHMHRRQGCCRALLNATVQLITSIRHSAAPKYFAPAFFTSAWQHVAILRSQSRRQACVTHEQWLRACRVVVASAISVLLAIRLTPMAVQSCTALNAARVRQLVAQLHRVLTWCASDA